MEQQDHDLLIELKTMVGVVIAQQNTFMASSQATMTALTERVSVLETKDSRDSEKVRAIDVNVQQSLKNYEKITALEKENAALRTELFNVNEDIKFLKNKANLWDIANSVGVAIAGIIGYFR